MQYHNAVRIQVRRIGPIIKEGTGWPEYREGREREGETWLETVAGVAAEVAARRDYWRGERGEGRERSVGTTHLRELLL